MPATAPFKFIITTISIAFIIATTAKSQSPTDSLKQLISHERNISQKVDLLFRLCDIYRSSVPDSCLAYARKAIAYLEEQKDTERIPKAELYIVSYYYLTGHADTALAILQKNIPLLENKPDQQSLLAQYYSS